ncbi:IBR domain-containing protein [Ceratobasidium theobromae]|uniref:IBR domain-containing protein n=1 Tax=Ceratobasidium theobromae TaxID=1582974 RepID=A0A5N5QN62_9AGAM|nr:IBR domain-containing protein [Ceratobasidium theobromae]
MVSVTRRVVATIPSPLRAGASTLPGGTLATPSASGSSYNLGTIITPFEDSVRMLAQEEHEERSIAPTTSENPPKSDFRCLICFEPKPRTAPSTSRCTHKSRVCEECLERHVQLSVCDRGFTNVTCPILACGKVLSYSDVRAAVKDRSVFER